MLGNNCRDTKMKFDVVLSNPPFTIKNAGWRKHTDKHLYLLKDSSYYALVCPASPQNDCIKKRIARFETLRISGPLPNFKELIKLNADVYYYIWKK